MPGNLPPPSRMRAMVRQARAARVLSVVAALAGLIGAAWHGPAAAILGGLVAAVLWAAKPPPE